MPAKHTFSIDKHSCLRYHDSCGLKAIVRSADLDHHDEGETVMNNNDSYKIGPRREFLLLAVPLFLIFLPFAFGIFEITVSQVKGAVGIVCCASILFFWRGGYYLIVDHLGIHEHIFGLCFRNIPWEQVSATVCYPTFNGNMIGHEIKILILLKGRVRNSGSLDSPEYYHFKHPLKSLYIDYGNYTTIFAKFTTLKTSDDCDEY